MKPRRTAFALCLISTFSITPLRSFADTPATTTVPAQRVILNEARMQEWEKEIRKDMKTLSQPERMRRQHAMILRDLAAAEDDTSYSYEEWANAVVKAYSIINGHYLLLHREEHNLKAWKARNDKILSVLKQTSSKRIPEFNALVKEATAFRSQLDTKLPQLTETNNVALGITAFCFQSPVKILGILSNEIIQCAELSEKARGKDMKIDEIFSAASSKASELNLKALNNQETPQITDTYTKNYLDAVKTAQDASAKLSEDYAKITTQEIAMLYRPVLSTSDTQNPAIGNFVKSNMLDSLQKIAKSNLQAKEKLQEIQAIYENAFIYSQLIKYVPTNHLKTCQTVLSGGYVTQDLAALFKKELIAHAQAFEKLQDNLASMGDKTLIPQDLINKEVYQGNVATAIPALWKFIETMSSNLNTSDACAKINFEVRRLILLEKNAATAAVASDPNKKNAAWLKASDKALKIFENPGNIYNYNAEKDVRQILKHSLGG